MLITEVYRKWNLHPDEKRKYPKAERRAPHKQQRDHVRAAQPPAINHAEFINPRTHRILVYVPLLLGICLRRCRSSRTCQSVAVHGSSAQSIACSCIYSTTVMLLLFLHAFTVLVQYVLLYIARIHGCFQVKYCITRYTCRLARCSSVLLPLRRISQHFTNIQL